MKDNNQASDKSVFLYVTGDDYSAMDFERRHKPKDFYESMIENNEQKVVLSDGGVYAIVRIIELNENISNATLDFIKDKLCEYDNLKATNLYKVV